MGAEGGGQSAGARNGAATLLRPAAAGGSFAGGLRHRPLGAAVRAGHWLPALGPNGRS